LNSRFTDGKPNYYYYVLFIFNCNWVDTRWQQYSTHLHTNSTQNTENGTYITIQKEWEVRAVPAFASYTLAFSLHLRKNYEKPQGSRKVPQYPSGSSTDTFTHKQYTEQHSEQNTQNGTHITIRILKITKERIT
jgi:hypothetical protein